MATIDGYYFRVCTRGAATKGIDVEQLLQEAGIDPIRLNEPGWRGDVAAMARLVRGIVAAIGDEYMGFTSHPLPIGAFAFAAGLAREGGTVLEGLRRAVRFYNLANRDIATDIVETDGEVIVTAEFASPALDPDHYFSEFWLIIWHRLACWLAGETVPLTGAEFDYPMPEEYFEEFRHLFPCPRRFEGNARRIHMDARALHGPVRRTLTELDAMLAVAPLDIMTIPASDHSLARQVRRLLAHNPGQRGGEVATALGLPVETLRGRLRREASSLATIREDLRRDNAIHALARGNRSVEAIAADLGYAEPRSFTRAFRAWTGMSPSEFRLRAHSTTPP